MENLVNIYNTNDLRWLLIIDDIENVPENYDLESLGSIFDDILKEDEKLAGNRYYTSFIEEQDYIIKMNAKLVIINSALVLIQTGYKNEALKLLDSVKSKSQTEKEIQLEYDRLIQRIELKALRNKRKQTKEPLNYGEMLVNIHQVLGIIPINPTVAMYRSYEKLVKSKIASQKKLNKK